MVASVPNKFVGTTTQDVSSLDANFDALVNFLNSGVDFQGAELVSSYAAIRALTASITSTTLAFTTGRLSMGDGGMGWFRADASDTTSADNDGTILVATDGMRWKRLFAGALNVLWFGFGGGVDIASLWANVVSASGNLYDIWFPPEHYYTSDYLDCAGLKFIDIYGDGFASHIENNSTTAGHGSVFVSYGPQRGTIPDFTTYALNDIVPSDHVLTFVTAADAANIVAGELYYLGSNDNVVSSTTVPLPTFSTIIKVVAVDTTGGTVTLDSALGWGVASPVISNTNTTANPTSQAGMLEEVGVHGFRFTTPQTASEGGKGINFAGMYKCHIHNIHENGQTAVSLNMIVRSHIHDLSFTLDDYGWGAYGAEIAWGCTDSTIENISTDVRNMNANTTLHPAVEVSEQGHGVTVRNIRVNAPESYFQDVIGLQGSVHTTVQNVHGVIGVLPQYQPVINCLAHSLSPSHDMHYVIDGVDMRVVSPQAGCFGVAIGGSASPNPFLKNIDIKNVHLDGDFSGDGLIHLTGQLENVTIEVEGTSGTIAATSAANGAVFNNVRILNSITDGPYSAGVERIYGSGNTRVGNASPPAARLAPTLVADTAANIGVLDYTLVGTDSKYQNDRFLIKCQGYPTGTAGAKTVAISIFGTVYTLASFAAADTGSSAPFTAEIELILSGDYTTAAGVYGTIRSWVKGVLTELPIYLSAVTFTGDELLQLQAWVAVSGDTVEIWGTIERLYQENTN